MDKNIRCTNCNSVDLILYNQEGPATTYVCTQCCHMEWFLNNDTMQLFFRYEKSELEAERTKLQTQIDELQIIISDPNQTLKAIKEARDKNSVLRETLKTVNDQLEKLV